MSTPEELKTESPAPERFTLTHIAGPQDDLLGLLKAEAQKASQAGRRPFVEFYADWCGPCNRLASHLGDPLMVDALDGTHIVKLNSDDWKWVATEAGFALDGIPAFFEIDADGKPTGRTVNGASWEEDIPANMAPPLKKFFMA
jgi:thiol-disulfide isomerase/thioredoxin